MKATLSLLVGLLVSSAIVCPEAHAVSGTANQRIFFNDQGQIIGESFRWCDSTTTHWGVALRESSSWAQGIYSCGVHESTSITYGTGLPAAIRSAVCSMPSIALCTQSLPWPSYDYVVGPITQGQYSD